MIFGQSSWKKGECGGSVVEPALDSGARGWGFEFYLHRVVSLSKTLHSPPEGTAYTQKAVATS